VQKAACLTVIGHLTEPSGRRQLPKSACEPFSSYANSITRCSILGPGLSDWIDLLAAFDASGIRYLVVGGIAVGFHGEPRFTKDLDLLVHVETGRHGLLHQVLREFGAPVGIIRPEEFLQDDFVFHFGSPPWRIDILTSIPGVDFEDAYAERVKLPLGDYSADCISKSWLVKAKRASGRPQDLLDLQGLIDEPPA